MARSQSFTSELRRYSTLSTSPIGNDPMFQTQHFYGSNLEAIKIHNFLHENLLHEQSCGAVKVFVNLIISPNRLLYSVVATQSTSYKHPKSETSMCAMYNLTFRHLCRQTFKYTDKTPKTQWDGGIAHLSALATPLLAHSCHFLHIAFLKHAEICVISI